MSGRDKAIAHYHRHIENVKAAVADDRLLMFSLGQGREPLRRFLGAPVPDAPFPNVNDRVAIKKIIAAMTRGV